MWKRRPAPVEEADDVVIDLRERLEPYHDVEPEAIAAWRRRHEAAPEAPRDTTWDHPEDWLV